MILYESEKVFITGKHVIIMIIYAAALSLMVIIPNGVTINASTDWKPVWSWMLFIYVIVVITLGFIPCYYISIKIYKEFADDQLKKKWKLFILGLVGLHAFTFGTLLSNTLNIQTFRSIWSLISLVLVIISPYLMYYGVGKQIRK